MASLRIDPQKAHSKIYFLTTTALVIACTLILLISAQSVSHAINCKYSEGIDTLETFGNCRFQIVWSSWISKNLVDLEKDQNTGWVENIQKHQEKDSFLYVTGDYQKDGKLLGKHLILNTKTSEVRYYSNPEEIPETGKQFFQ